jgi:predicted ATPase/DNA-binding winged helix-turn-helix (wHTH) protein
VSHSLARYESIPNQGSEEFLVFGPFQLNVPQRLLYEQGNPVQITSRALEMLIVLAERPGQLVSKREFISRVWQDRVVEDVALRVHIAALRRILKDGQHGYRYIGTVPGCGYRFMVDVRREPHAPAAAVGGAEPDTSRAATEGHPLGTRSLVQRVVGRAQTIRTLAERLPQCGFVSIVGPGGCGKTTVALGVAEAVRALYPQGVHVVDLASITEPSSVIRAVGSTLATNGLAVDYSSGVLPYLREQALLLVLDNCEHLAEAAATFAETVREQCPGVHILTTSREPLRAAQEYVYRLSGLTCPPEDVPLAAERLLRFSAVELFVELSRTHLRREIHSAELDRIGQLCHRLEGNPLAIQIAAGRMDVLGVQGLWESLRERTMLSLVGRRTSPPRHQTLRATFEWSYGLLPQEEQMLFRRLAVFCRGFSLQEAAQLVIEPPFEELGTVLGALVNLCAKSLVVAADVADTVSYRLLDTTRAYAMYKLSSSSQELAETQLRHAVVAMPSY